MSNETFSPLGLPIPKAATHIGFSRGQFYREFLNTGRIRAIHSGKRARIVLVAELEAAFLQYVEEKRGGRTDNSQIAAA